MIALPNIEFVAMGVISNLALGRGFPKESLTIPYTLAFASVGPTNGATPSRFADARIICESKRSKVDDGFPISARVNSVCKQEDKRSICRKSIPSFKNCLIAI
jgi:hypothetical protein